MKIQMTFTAIYDLDDPDFRNEYEEAQWGNELDFENLKEFVMDRFINPNFDTDGELKITIIPETLDTDEEIY